MSDQFHTEGCIKEIKLNDQGISVKLDPSEKFSFGEGESSDKRLVLLEGESEDKAELVAQSVEFEFENGGIKESFDANFLFALKKDRAKLRVSVKKMSEENRDGEENRDAGENKNREENKNANRAEEHTAQRTGPVYTITALRIL